MSSQVLTTVEPKMARAVEVMERDFTGIRTGRASTALVERLLVEYYGTPTPLNQLSTINVPEPRMLTIQPFDPNSIKTIEKALMDPLDSGDADRIRNVFKSILAGANADVQVGPQGVERRDPGASSHFRITVPALHKRIDL